MSQTAPTPLPARPGPPPGSAPAPLASRQSGQALVLLAATLTTGLTAGTFADWAHTVMRALHPTDDRTFVAVFQSLDDAILNPLFMLTFFGGLVLSGAAAVFCVVDGHHPALRWVAAAFGLQLVAVAITMGVHEPLNLVVRDAGDPAGLADPAAVRDAFHETRWVVWHAVRTIATTAAFACLAWSLILHGRVAAGPGTAGQLR